MAPADHSAEVADDYRRALEDLTMNSRYEIANLTVIARENTEHAQAIADVITDHIRKVPPQKKLPALYVLDSVVKNVGTPYTLFFSRKLFASFMDAYASVDQTTRRKMDEMLKTWKEPIPGSMDPKPPFPIDVVRPIENALIQARTTAFQAQQENLRGQQQLLSRGRAPIPYRETPTPPDARPGSIQSGPYGQQPFPGMNGNQGRDTAGKQQLSYPIHPNNPSQSHTVPQSSIPQPPQSAPPSIPYQQPPQGAYGGAQLPGISIDALNNDIQQLIVASKAEFAQNPLDTSIQTRLRALLDLQSLLQGQNLPQEQLVLVKNQVAELAVNIRAPNAAGHLQTQAHNPHARTLTHTPTPPLVSQHQLQHQATMPLPTAVAPPPSASAPPAPLSIDSLFGQGALATLLAGAHKSATPQLSSAQLPAPPPASVAAIRSPPPAQRAEPARGAPPPPPSDPLALLGMLRKAGMLPAAPAGGSLPVPMPSQGVLPPPGIVATSMKGGGGTFLEDAGAEIALKASSLKQFRPHLIPLVYDALGKPCTQCGRRFRNDDEGRRRKTAHLDWHFRVHQRIAEAEKRGQHRSWYVDQMDWIHSREAVDTDHVDGPSESGSTLAGASGGPSNTRGQQRPQQPYIPAPDPSSGTNTVCPICQEKFEMKWLDGAQEWVWTDAVRVGGRVYHASCHAEATKDGGGGGAGAYGARGTPDPVLGKRKAEDGHSALRGKVKMDAY